MAHAPDSSAAVMNPEIPVSRPLVTIVTPSYNQGHFIQATIESVLTQDYPHIEYIIMDGASTDDTAEVVRPYLDRLTFISEKDRGQTHAINKGFQRARGPIVAWLNSDDTLLPGAVTTAVNALEQHPDVGALYGEGFQIDYDGNVKQQFPYTEPFNLWKLTYVLDYVLQQSVFFRRACLEELGWLEEELHYGMDWDILIRLGKQYGLVYIPALLGCLREYEAAKSSAGGARRFKELARLLRAHTGQRRPPGWWFYGLDTYGKLVAGALQRHLPGSLGQAAVLRLTRLYHARMDREQHESQGLYPDGWAGQTVHWMMPASFQSVEIRGSVPEPETPGQHQRLAVFVNGTLALEQLVGPGNFVLSLPLPGKTAALLRVEASSVLPRKQKTLATNLRPVAWRVHEFRGLR